MYHQCFEKSIVVSLILIIINKRTIVKNDGPFLRPGMMPEFLFFRSASLFLYYCINEIEHMHTFGINIIRLNLNQIRIMLISLV